MKNVQRFILWNIVPALVFIAAKTYQIPELVNVTLALFWFVSIVTTFVLLPVMVVTWNTLKNDPDKVTVNAGKLSTTKESTVGEKTSSTETTLNTKVFGDIPELGTPRYYASVVFDLIMVLVFINFGYIYLAIFYWLHTLAQYKTIELLGQVEAIIEAIEAADKID